MSPDPSPGRCNWQASISPPGRVYVHLRHGIGRRGKKPLTSNVDNRPPFHTLPTHLRTGGPSHETSLWPEVIWLLLAHHGRGRGSLRKPSPCLLSLDRVRLLSVVAFLSLRLPFSRFSPFRCAPLPPGYPNSIAPHPAQTFMPCSTSSRTRRSSSRSRTARTRVASAGSRTPRAASVTLRACEEQ